MTNRTQSDNDAAVDAAGEVARRAAIGTRVREARRLSGLSQRQVAEILGLHRPAVSEIEAGNRRVTAEEIGRLAAMFDVSVSWLLNKGNETVGINETRVQLAARELSKLKPDDLNRLLSLLASMRGDAGSSDQGDASPLPRGNP